MANNLDLSKPPIFTDGSGKSRTAHSGNTTPSLQSEMRRRAFWAVYTLDSYLATMLGKNLTFDDRDIRIGYPSLLDDSQIAPLGIGSEEDSDRPPLMLGPIAHAKLARIVRRILTHLYHDQALELQFEYADILLREITEWDNELPEYLRTKPSGSLLNIYARQSSVIQLAKQHALILLYRPFLPLSGLATTPIHGEGVDVHTISQYQDRCLDAALRICQLVTPLMRRANVNGNYWFTAYIVFCAATVLLVYLGHHTTTSRRDEIWDAAEKCCDIERKLMDTNYLARRYVAAIEGLLARVLKRSQTIAPLTNVSIEAGVTQGGEAMDHSAIPFPHWPGDSGGFQSLNQMARPQDDSYFAYSDLPGELFSQPSLDQLISGTYGSNFADLDSLVTGGMEFGWFS